MRNIRKYLTISMVLVIIAGTYCTLYLPILNNTMDIKLSFINMTADDAFYYLNIAKNIINHSFSSFDGLTETNGYQPLWLFILVKWKVFCGNFHL